MEDFGVAKGPLKDGAIFQSPPGNERGLGLTISVFSPPHFSASPTSGKQHSVDWVFGSLKVTHLQGACTLLPAPGTGPDITPAVSLSRSVWFAYPSAGFLPPFAGLPGGCEQAGKAGAVTF